MNIFSTTMNLSAQRTSAKTEMTAKNQSQAPRSGQAGRTQKFMADLRSQLADGNWHSISPVNMGTVHNVSFDLMKHLVTMGCLETRAGKPGGTGQQSAEFRRTSALGNLRTEIFIERSRLLRREHKLTHVHDKQDTPIELEMTDLPFIPPTQEQVSSGFIPFNPVAEKTLNTISSTASETESEMSDDVERDYMILCDGKFMSRLMGTKSLIMDDLAKRAEAGKEYMLVELLETFIARVTLERS